MTTYDITLRGLKRNQVMDIVDALPKGIVFHCHRNEETVQPTKKPNGKAPYAKDNDILSLTGKHAQKGSAREAILETLEKMEAKKSIGIGGVTRKMLREECAAQGQDSQIIYQLIRDGYLKTIGEQ